MKTHIRRTIVCGLAAGMMIALPGPAEAQRVPADTTLGGALEELRRGVLRIAIARHRLSQEWGPESPGELEALADSLVAIATAYHPGGSLSELGAASRAISALGGAGLPGTRIPYTNALEALARIHRGSEDVGLQSGVMVYMTRLADTTGVVPFFREVALQDRPSARAAIGSLAAMGSEGVAVLYELHHEDLVEHPSARRTLHGFAARQGWEPRIRLSDCKATIRKVDPETGELGERECLSGPPTVGGGG